MASIPLPRLTSQEYLATERSSSVKHEFLDGEMFDMGGASKAHNLITLNFASALHSQLRGRPCLVLASDMRVKISDTGLYTYPDISALCGEPLFEDAQLDTLLNPSLIVEVLSPSTEAHDRGKKFAHYRRLPSFVEYVLVSQDVMRVEHFVRQPDGQWLMEEKNRPADVLKLSSVDCSIVLSDIYERVDRPDRQV